MNDFDRKLKGLAALNERLQGFLQDGYHVVVNFKDDTLCLIKLRHHNGNKITLKLNIPSGELSQLTNHVKVFSQKVY